MRLLLDECLPVRLGRELVPHEVDSVTMVGWNGVRNGDLLRRAADIYDVFVTVDQRLSRDSVLPANLALITLHARSNSITSVRPLVPALLELFETIQPGESLKLSTD